MPFKKHYNGKGREVMSSMMNQYGKEKGKKVFYATENKKKKSNLEPSEEFKKKHGVK